MLASKTSDYISNKFDLQKIDTLKIEMIWAGEPILLLVFKYDVQKKYKKTKGK